MHFNDIDKLPLICSKNCHEYIILIIILFSLSGCYVATKQASYSDTSLMWAIKNGDTEKVKLLLEESSDVNQQHSVTGETPLIYATRKNNIRMVSLLLRHGADNEIRDKMGNSALDWASRNGNSYIIGIILKKNASNKIKRKSVTPLLSAIYSSKLVTVKYLLESGLPVNGHDSFGDTPFIAAIKMGNAEIMFYLLAHGADSRATDKLGRSALMLSSQTGYMGIISYLIKEGHDINKQSIKGRTALMFAAVNARAGIVKLLLDQGADLNLRDNEGHSAIYFSAANKRWFIIDMLLNAGADLSLEPMENIHATSHVTAPLYAIAGEYYLKKNNREKAIKYYELSKESYINLSKKYKSRADSEARNEIFSLIGRSLLMTAVAAGQERNARIQARQQAQLYALKGKPGNYTIYSKRASSNYHKYYRINKIAAENQMQQYYKWGVPDSLVAQSVVNKKERNTILSAWAEKTAKKIGLKISCIRESSKKNIKDCN
ncbi:MAG TPA: hypothetical protein ENI65_09785 [Gammaproteobacteria bacterium]|nr:hypothetical protein [Gammaproteobacteria bacterium]